MPAAFICTTCGTQFPPAEVPPSHCPICEDERQYVNPNGQSWTTPDDLRRKHSADIRNLGPSLTGIGATPPIAIGQRALLVSQPGGGVMWDSIPLVTDDAITAIEANGGVRAIAISHPHFYTAMVEWSEALDNSPIYLHEDNRPFVMRPSPNIRFWSGETLDLGQGITLIRCGGHFEGSTALHWSAGAEGRGALFTGDTIMVAPDMRWMSFMRSFPNYIPLNRRAVERIAAAVEPYPFDKVYGAWWTQVVPADGKLRLARSVERYLQAISTHKIYLGHYLDMLVDRAHLPAYRKIYRRLRMHNPFDHEEHHRERHWRRFEAMARRGFRAGFGGPGGFGAGIGMGANWGGMGDNFRVGRMLASGDLRLIALFFIEEQPRHGYDLIKAIEDKTSGFYSPSPGIVYPALTFLEEAGFVTSSAEGNKKLYTITEEGRAHLGENREAVQTTLDFLGKAGERMAEWREKAGRDGGWWGDKRDEGRRGGPARDRDIPGVIEEVNIARKDLKAAISDAIDNGDEDAQRRLADILRKAAELIRRRDVDLG